MAWHEDAARTRDRAVVIGVPRARWNQARVYMRCQMLVLKRKLEETVTITRPWASPDTAPIGVTVLILRRVSGVAIFGRRVTRGGWLTPDGVMLPEESVEGWQPAPTREREPITIKLCEILSAGRVKLGIEAPHAYKVLRGELG